MRIFLFPGIGSFEALAPAALPEWSPISIYQSQSSGKKNDSVVVQICYRVENGDEEGKENGEIWRSGSWKQRRR